MLEKIKVIAFDIDGTFYVIKNFRFYLHFQKVRKIMHRTGPLPDFYEFQARLLARELDCSAAEAKKKIQEIVYDGLTPYFKKVKTFKGVEECFKALRKAGYRIAILSDFPPSQKGELWNLSKYCECIYGTEEIGALKPSKFPFGVLSITMNVKPEEVLYVGNSIRYDVIGAMNAGMMSALIAPKFVMFLKKMFKLNKNSADINFSTYRQLVKIVLE